MSHPYRTARPAILLAHVFGSLGVAYDGHTLYVRLLIDNKKLAKVSYQDTLDRVSRWARDRTTAKRPSSEAMWKMRSERSKRVWRERQKTAVAP